MPSHFFPPSTAGLIDLPRDIRKPNYAHTLLNWVPTQTGIQNRKGQKLLMWREPTFTGRPVLHVFNSPNPAINEQSIFWADETGLYADGPRDFEQDIHMPMKQIAASDWTDSSSTTFTDLAGNTRLILLGPDFIAAADDQEFRINQRGLVIDDNGNTKPASDFNYVFSYKQRLVFIERNTLTAWYSQELGIGIDNTLRWLDWNLAPQFARGGHLLFGGSVSKDTGAGPDDFLFFVTSEGEVSLYQINVLSVGDINHIGIFQIPKPLGKRAHAKVDGDVHIATENGLISLLSILRSTTTYISSPIQDTWRRLTARYPTDWEMTPTPIYGENFILMYPGQESNIALLLNIQTGAWSELNMPVDSTNIYQDQLIMADGKSRGVYLYQGGQDEYWDGLNEGEVKSRPIFLRFLPRPTRAGSHYMKRTTISKLEYEADFDVGIRMFSTSMDKVKFPTYPAAKPEPGTFVLGESRLGEAGLPPGRRPYVKNIRTPSRAKNFSSGAVATIHSVNNPNLEIIALETEFEQGSTI